MHTDNFLLLTDKLAKCSHPRVLLYYNSIKPQANFKKTVMTPICIWCIVYDSINRPGDIDLWPFDLYIGSRVSTKGNRRTRRSGLAWQGITTAVIVLVLKFAENIKLPFGKN